MDLILRHISVSVPLKAIIHAEADEIEIVLKLNFDIWKQRSPVVFIDADVKLAPDAAAYFDEHAVVIAQCARALADYGVEPRHLRAFRSAADRQSDLIAQIAGPLVKTDKVGARDRAGGRLDRPEIQAAAAENARVNQRSGRKLHRSHRLAKAGAKFRKGR